MTTDPSQLHPARSDERGAIAWMARNKVAANLLMLVLIIGGFYATTQIRREVFPDFTLDTVVVSVVYPGASPEEVERGIVLAVEEAVRTIEGVKRINSVASENAGAVNVEVIDGFDPTKVERAVDQAVRRITTFPADIEVPRVALAERRGPQMSLRIFGPLDAHGLRAAAEQTRDLLLADPGITQVDISGVRTPEVKIEISQAKLDAYGMTLDEMAGRIRQNAIDVPAGEVTTKNGAILVRVKDRKLFAEEIGEIPVITQAGGGILRVRDIANVIEGFDDVEKHATFNGHPAAAVTVFRTPSENPIDLSERVNALIPEIEATLPEAVALGINYDGSEYYQQRLELLVRNAFVGLVLVLILLGVFLRPKVAFWVTMGIPTSFLGAVIFLPFFDISINVVSMFAFIIALGIVVDDAIVAGENIYEALERGASPMQAAIVGAKTVAIPITFSVLTNIVAFLPLLSMPGFAGKIWYAIPVVVTTVFSISLIEAVFILPAHLNDLKTDTSDGRLACFRDAVSAKLSRFVEGPYSRLLDRAARHRYLTSAIAISILAVTLAYAISGRMGFSFMPRVESDEASLEVALPYGVHPDTAKSVAARIQAAGTKTIAQNGGKRTGLGTQVIVNGNKIDATMFLQPPTTRDLSTKEVANRWRDILGMIPEAESVRFDSDRGGPGSGRGLRVELKHRNIETLTAAAKELSERLMEFPSVVDTDDGSPDGKRQLDFSINESGRALGFTSAELGRQLRSAFYGAEALRQQRGRDEVRVTVRLPDDERASELDVRQLRLRAPSGSIVPINAVADIKEGKAYTRITRINGQRTLAASADVKPADQTSRVLEALESDLLPELKQDYPGLDYSFGGREEFRREAGGALKKGFMLSLIAIYILLVLPFKSFSQPLIILMAIPFGIVGAVIGHLVMGFDLSTISQMGMVALAGVVVNDALVMVDYANRKRQEGLRTYEAIMRAGKRRFRPILLTTLTTFFGLAPMIFETSRAAQFLIPMALSMGFGIVFATAITLILVPCFYLIIEDGRLFVARATQLVLKPVRS